MTRTRILKLQHSSLEVFDSFKQHVADADKVFSLGSDIITGTEAGLGAAGTREALHAAARRLGYRFWCPGKQDSWVAIRKDLGPRVDRGLIPVLESAKSVRDPHPYTAKGIPWMTVRSELLGEISVGAGHWLTKGRWKHQAQDDKKNDPVDHFEANTLMGEAVADWARDKGAGSAIVFYGADTNLNDRNSDVFRGQPLTTCWDEVGKWPNTGHGPIDVLATYDRDRRVECLSAEVLDDRRFFLHADHFTITARYRVTLKETA